MGKNPQKLFCKQLQPIKPLLKKEKNTEKDNPIVQNTKNQTQKPFNLETEIGKLKIAIPLSELSKHDVYRGQISRSLQIPLNQDSVNVFND